MVEATGLTLHRPHPKYQIRKQLFSYRVPLKLAMNAGLCYHRKRVVSVLITADKPQNVKQEADAS